MNPRSLPPIVALISLLALPAAQGQDAAEVVRQLEAALCSFPVGQITEDPHGLTRQLFETSADANFDERRFNDEIWLGPWEEGDRRIDRYLAFHPHEQGYVVVDCIPFQATARRSTAIDGRSAEIMRFAVYDETPRGYNLVDATYVMESDRRTLVAAEFIDPFLHEKGIQEWDEPIADPWYWAEVRFDVDAGGTRESIWGFEVDLDHDEVTELGITSLATHGTGGGEYAFFRKDGANYRFIGYLGINTLQVLPLNEDGSMRLRTTWHMNASCASVATYTNDGSRFQSIEQLECADIDDASDGEFIVPGQHQFRPSSWLQVRNP